MPPRLIVNADDFGLTRGINTAVIELFAAGVITSATLMANGPAFEHAVMSAHQHPQLGVGCHVVLTDGEPVSPPDQIPSLMARDGRSFRPSLRDFLFAALAGRIREDDVRREVIAQVQKLQRAGIAVTHLDTHKHTHVLPQIVRPLLQAAEATNVGAVRNPFEGRWSLRFGYGRPLRLLQVAAASLGRRRFLAQPSLRSGRIVTTEGTIGISATGLLDQNILRKIMDSMPDGTWELVCHPGYNDADLGRVRTRLRGSREVERRALVSVLSQPPQSSSNPMLPELIHYGRLQHSDGQRVSGSQAPAHVTVAREDQERASA